MASIFNKFKKGLSKTREGLVDEIVKLVKNKYTLDDEDIDQIEEALIRADIGVEVSLQIIDRLKARINKEGFRDDHEIMAFLKAELLSQLTIEKNGQMISDFFSPEVKPFVIMVVGVNGTGKTTTIGKLANIFHVRGQKVLLAAADTFRAAASEQLEIWANRVNVDVVRTQAGGDPAALAFDALNAAIARNIDVLIVDTAGRLHTKINLMEELKKISRVLAKRMDSAPHEVLLVLDASTGQNALVQARQFKEAVPVTGVVVTKLDGTAKGGMVLGVQSQLGLPIKFVGLGESMDDLRAFDPNIFVEALFQ